MDNKPLEVSIYAVKYAILVSLYVRGSTRCAIEKEMRGFRLFVTFVMFLLPSVYVSTEKFIFTNPRPCLPCGSSCSEKH
jgi:hypothetical protein